MRVMAAGTILELALLHAYDLRIGSGFQTAVTAVKVFLFLTFIFGVMLGTGDAAGGWDGPQARLPDHAANRKL